MGRHAPREECFHLIECSSTYTCNASRSGVVHTPCSHGRTNFGSEGCPLLSPISSETIACIWLSVLFCGLYSAATGGARVPTLPCFRVPVKYLGWCVCEFCYCSYGGVGQCALLSWRATKPKVNKVPPPHHACTVPSKIPFRVLY